MKLWIFFLLCVAQALYAAEADPDIVKVPVKFVDRYQPSGGFRASGVGAFRPVARRVIPKKRIATGGVVVEEASFLEKEDEGLEEALHSSLKKDEDFEKEWHSSLHDVDIGKVEVALQRRDSDALFYVSSDEGEVDDAEDFIENLVCLFLFFFWFSKKTLGKNHTGFEPRLNLKLEEIFQN